MSLSVHSQEPFLAGVGRVAFDGNYTIEGLESGTYTLVGIATHGIGPDEFKDMRWAATRVEISESETSDIDFDMAAF